MNVAKSRNVTNQNLSTKLTDDEDGVATAADLRLMTGPSWHLKTVEIVESVKIDNAHSENDAKTEMSEAKRKIINWIGHLIST